MGVGWRRFTERLHQNAPLTASRDFQPTSNARCSTMLKEADDFAKHLKKSERAIQAMAAANADAAGTIKIIMQVPLPRRYEETAAAAGGATTGGISPIGGAGFDGDAVTRAVQEAGHKMETEVLAPLNRWTEVYVQLAGRFRELEAVRLEVDSRRRTVADLAQKVDAARSRLGKGSDAKQEASMEESVKRLQHKEGKLQVATQTFIELEQLLHRDLSTLVTDAQWLKHYAAAALRLQGNSLLQAADAFGDASGNSPPAARLLAVTAGRPAVVPSMQRAQPATVSEQGSRAASPVLDAQGSIESPAEARSPGPSTPLAQLPQVRYPVVEK